MERRGWREVGRPFADDADFVNIRGEHFQTREAIAQGHQHIFNMIYKGPTGPLAGQHSSLLTLVLVQDQNDWRIAAFHNTLVT